ncbi:MAG: META domain-containing protein [Actinobacteria bacterium]|nr:META domain-containing protein [Actinomycetota bacterium]
MLLFVRREMRDITQEKWMLVEYDDGRGGLVPVLPGTMATLRLTAGQVWGSTGANRYAGPCAISESEISVGPLLHTRLTCSDSVMEQEAHFLALLEFVDSFVVCADRLDLRWDNRSGLVFTPMSDRHGLPNLVESSRFDGGNPEEAVPATR